MDALRDATPEEVERINDFACSFFKWGIGKGKKDNTVKSYVRAFKMVFEEDKKALDVMATPEYFALVKESPKNKSGNGQRSAAIRLFSEFWSQRDPNEPLEELCNWPALSFLAKAAPGQGTDAGGGKKAKRAAAGAASAPAAVEPAAAAAAAQPVAKQPPAEPGGADAAAAESHGPAMPPSEASPPSASVVGAAALREGASPRRTRTAAGQSEGGGALAAGASQQASEASPASPAASATAATTACAAAAADASGAEAARDRCAPPPQPAQPSARRRVPLAEALRSIGLEGARRREAVLFHGRRAEAPNAQRIQGVYLRGEGAEDLQHDGRPVWHKVCGQPTVLCYADASGMWRVTAACSTKGDFTHVKDPAMKPWEVAKVWRVFVGGKEYSEDPNLRLCLLDMDALPEGVEVPAPEPSSASSAAPAPAAAAPAPAAAAPLAGKAPEPAAAPAPAAAPSAEGPATVRRTAPLQEALVAAGVANAPFGTAVLVRGRDPEAKNAQRLLGLYVREAELHNGRPWWQKVHTDKRTAIFFNEGKSRWQISKDVAAKGDFAHTKDAAPVPWQTTGVWRVFDGERHGVDPSVRVEAVDPKSLPCGVEVAVPELAAEGEPQEGAPDAKRRRRGDPDKVKTRARKAAKDPEEGREAPAGSDAAASADVSAGTSRQRKRLASQLSDDGLAPASGAAGQKAAEKAQKSSPWDVPRPGNRGSWYIHIPGLGRSEGRIQTTEGVCGSAEAAQEVLMKILRKSTELGWSKEQALQYRGELYAEIRAAAQGGAAPPKAPAAQPKASSQPEEGASPQPQEEPDGPAAEPREPGAEEQEADDDDKEEGPAAEPREPEAEGEEAADDDRDEGGPADPAREQQASNAGAVAPPSVSSSSSSSPSGSDEDDDDADQEGGAVDGGLTDGLQAGARPVDGGAAPRDAYDALRPPRRTGRPPSGQRVAAKMSVLTGFRCACCYQELCRASRSL